MALQVPAASEPSLANRGRDARLAVIIDLLAQIAGVPINPSAQSGVNGAGSIFTSANASAADAAITAAPTVGSALVVDSVQISVDTAMNVLLKEETSGTVIAGPFYMTANSTLNLSIEKQLPTINKKLMIRTSVAGNIMALASYHSNP